MALSKFNIASLLGNSTGVEPVEFSTSPEPEYERVYASQPYEPRTTSPGQKESLFISTPLYKQNHLGYWYFMPVSLRHPSLKEYVGEEGILEFQNAVISIVGRKNIVSTPMVGRKGTVKELISIDDYKISINALLYSEDGGYPEKEINALMGMFRLNEPVEIICALTDLVLEEDDMVVVTDVTFESPDGKEEAQVVKLECVSDKEFELIIS